MNTTNQFYSILSILLFLTVSIYANDLVDIQPRTYKRAASNPMKVYVENDTSQNGYFKTAIDTKPTNWNVSLPEKFLWADANSTEYVTFDVKPPSWVGTCQLGGLLQEKMLWVIGKISHLED